MNFYIILTCFMNSKSFINILPWLFQLMLKQNKVSERWNSKKSKIILKSNTAHNNSQKWENEEKEWEIIVIIFMVLILDRDGLE